MDIVADLETARTHLRLYAVVDTLKYLHKGGRLSGAVAIAGGLLGIKPGAFSGRPRQAGHGGQSPWHARRICRHF